MANESYTTLKLKTKVYKDGEWVSNDDANEMISAYVGKIYDIRVALLTSYIANTNADKIRVFETRDLQTGEDALVVKCFRYDIERYYDGNGKQEVLEHINPVHVDFEVKIEVKE